MRVCVVVLGDIGRSPRMMFHSQSLTSAGFDVDLVGYGGSSPSKSLLENEKIKIHQMPEPPLYIKQLPRLIGYGLKAIWQFLTLLYALFSLSKPSHVLVQNPPSVPTLAAVWIYSLIRRCKLIVDWHNYGYSILAISLKEQHLLVKSSKWFELYFGSKAHAHICVTKALQKDLADKIINATVLYDCPPDHYRPISMEIKYELLNEMCKLYPCFRSKENQNESKFLTSFNGLIESKSDRPAILVSSTSWTEDEDFSILLKALENYEQSIVEYKRTDLPNILCVITGKGPMKEFYESKLKDMKFDHVEFCFPWLSAEDYPKMLATADIGVCLHTSSSGLDLPMKVVDMFGCGLPVLAFKYNCIHELVKTDINGYVFDSSDQLKEHIQMLLSQFPSLSPEMKTLRDNMNESNLVRWDASWNQHALPLFQD